MKASSFLLCLCLCLLLCAPGTASAPVRLMVVADLHYLDPAYMEDQDRLIEHLRHGDGKMTHQSEAWLAALVDEARLIRPDALILSGDQTLNGEPRSHMAVAEALSRLQSEGIAVHVIPGNHDINGDAYAYTREEARGIASVPPEKYDAFYSRFGIEQALSRDAESRSYAAEISDRLWLVMLDAGIYEPVPQASGMLLKTTEAWLEEVLTAAHDAGAQVITVTHQSLLPHNDLITSGYMVVGWEEITDLLIGHGVRLNLSGHIHVQHIARKDTLYDVSTSSLSSAPHQYGVVTVSDDGRIEYRAHALRDSLVTDEQRAESTDFLYQVSYDKAVSALEQSGVSPAQKEAMAAFAAEVNVHYVAGTLAAIRQPALADDLYALWLQDASFWNGYLQSILSPEQDDMTSLIIEP